MSDTRKRRPRGGQASVNTQLLSQFTELNDLFTACMESSSNALLVVDDTGHVMLSNSLVEQYFGLPPVEVAGYHIDSILQQIRGLFRNPDDFDKRVRAARQRAAEANRVEESLAALVHEAMSMSEPRAREVSIYHTGIWHRDGKRVGELWSFTDATQLKHDDDLLHAIGEASPTAFLVTRVHDGMIMYANEVLAQLIGTTAEELVGSTTPNYYVRQEDRADVLSRLENEGEIRNYEIKLKRIDDTEFWAILSLNRLELAGEQMVIGSIYDISDRKDTEVALRQSEQRFRSVVENANEIIFTLDRDWTISYISPNVSRYLGYTPNRAIGTNWLNVIHPDDHANVSDYVEEVFRTGRANTRLECRLQHVNGDWRWYRSSGSAHTNPDDGSPYYIGIGHDVSEQLRARQELEQTQFMLVQSDKMASLGSLVAGIAHEINTPVGAIISMHDTLLRAFDKLRSSLVSTPLDAKDQKLLKVIDDSNAVISNGADRVAEIVKRLRSFARLDEAELKEADIEHGISDTLMLVHHDLKYRITVERDFGNIPKVACYPGRLNQVFLNLLVNASQAIDGEGNITIKTWATDTEVHVSITDTGIGIAKENIAKLFEPGFTTKGVGVGTGLGLSICYSIVQDHGGQILVRSELGTGSTFEVVLPRKPKDGSDLA